MLLAVAGVSLAGVGGQAVWRGASLAHAGAFQFEAFDAVNDRISNVQIANDLVPASHGNLAGDQQRALVVAVVDDLQQVAALFGGQWLGPPVVDDQQSRAFQHGEQFGEG